MSAFQASSMVRRSLTVPILYSLQLNELRTIRHCCCNWARELSPLFAAQFGYHQKLENHTMLQTHHLLLTVSFPLRSILGNFPSILGDQAADALQAEHLKAIFNETEHYVIASHLLDNNHKFALLHYRIKILTACDQKAVRSVFSFLFYCNWKRTVFFPNL